MYNVNTNTAGLAVCERSCTLMRASVFQKAVSLLLCAVLTVGFFPGVDAHAEEADGALSAEQRQAVVSRQMDGWVFPLPEEFFDDITDFSGCRGQNPSALYDGTNPGCTHAGHADAPAGSTGLYVNVTGQQPVYAPAGGTVYFGNDAQWGSVAVVEVPVSGDYSYYILLGSVSPALGSGSYVDAGTTLGTTGGEFRMAALMDYAGMGEQIAAGVSSELTAVESFGWLVGSTGTGLICVNPSGNTQSQYPSSLASSFPGPITYSFAAAQPPVTEHTHVFDQQVASDAYLAAPATADSPAMYYYSCLCGEKGTETFPYGDKAGHTFSPDWSYDENNHWHADTCGHPDITDSFGPHQWDAGAITVQPTHTAAGTMVYTCTVCGAQKSETLNPTAEHVFDQQVVSDAYLASPATADSPAMYYYSCICGEKGTETFPYGDKAGHTFSPDWSYDENNHWHADTCGHPDITDSFGPHEWNAGEITVQPTHTAAGTMVYTCTVCGVQKSETLNPTTEHVFDQQVVSDAYLASPATADSPAMYYYSCLCGEKGTETFPYGEKAGHTFSPDWSYDENNHWHADTCGHPDVTDSFGPHQWNAGEITVQPTHTAAGTMVYTCTVCGAQKSETLNPTTEHVFDQMNTDAKYLKSEATCTAPAEYYYSCICGEKGTETFAYGQAKGHSFSDKWSFDAENHWHPATCEHTGEQGSFGPHRWNYGEITKNAGHAVDGEKLYTCLDCGYQKTEVIPGQAHEFNQMVAQDKYLAAAATCTTPAQYYYSCTCGLAGTDTFPYGNAKGHTFADKWSYNELQHWKAATCEHTNEKIQVADHIWNPGVITTQPTATTKGVKTYTCSVCGATKTEEVEPSTHQHTFSTAWQGNATYHWHPATCEHTNVVSGLGEHQWNAGVVNVWPTHTTTGMKTYTCTVCNLTKTETLEQTHTFDQMNPSSAFLKSQATCTSPAVYYKSCSCGAKGTETFTYGNALGHTASGTWGKDANYHWTVCSRCGAKGDLVAHSFDNSGKCTVCGYSKEEAHVHTSHLTKVPAKAATCTTEGNTGYYTCECGAWFTDVTCKTPINDHQSVVIPATGHVDSNGDGRCDVCRQRMDNTVEYQVTEGGEATWLNTSNQGMVFRSNAEYAKFDRIEVDGATVTAGNYSVSEGSTVVELSASYLKRLSLGRHTLSIVSKDGKASTGFTIKQGATAAKSGGPWGMILLLTVVVAIAIPVTFGVMYYRKKTGYND